MKVEGWLFLGCGIFFGGADIVYWYTSKEPTGTVALALCVGLAILTGFYVLFTGRRLPRRPEDDNRGEIEQGTGEIGFFSPHSWWPLWMGLATATAAVGFAVGWYLPSHPEQARPAAEAALKAVGQGLIDLSVETLPLADAAEAHRRLENGAVGGRIVLSP